MTLWLPDRYQAGVRVEMSQHSPLSCRAILCSGAVRSHEGGQRLTIGAPEGQVRLSSRSGPVTIASVRY